MTRATTGATDSHERWVGDTYSRADGRGVLGTGICERSARGPKLPSNNQMRCCGAVRQGVIRCTREIGPNLN